VRTILRADSVFAHEALMAWCEENQVDYVFGLARNARLEARIGAGLTKEREMSESGGAKPARDYRDFLGTTKES
jgi:Transposase DDE domain group 1